MLASEQCKRIIHRAKVYECFDLTDVIQTSRTVRQLDLTVRSILVTERK